MSIRQNILFRRNVGNRHSFIFQIFIQNLNIYNTNIYLCDKSSFQEILFCFLMSFLSAASAVTTDKRGHRSQPAPPPPLPPHLFSLLPFASFFPALIYCSVPVIYGFYEDTKLFKWNLPIRFYRIAFQKHFVKFIGKHLHRSSILSKGAGPGRSWRSIIEQVWKTVYDFLGACNQLLPKI